MLNSFLEFSDTKRKDSIALTLVKNSTKDQPSFGKVLLPMTDSHLMQIIH